MIFIAGKICISNKMTICSIVKDVAFAECTHCERIKMEITVMLSLAFITFILVSSCFFVAFSFFLCKLTFLFSSVSLCENHSRECKIVVQHFLYSSYLFKLSQYLWTVIHAALKLTILYIGGTAASAEKIPPSISFSTFNAL